MDRLEEWLREDEQQLTSWIEQRLSRVPDCGVAHFYRGTLHDRSGNEEGAIPHYEQALASLTDPEMWQRTCIQLGSTYRCIGRYEEAQRVLTSGQECFPDNQAIGLFLAMTLYNLGLFQDAARIWITLALSEPDEWLKRYEKAIRFYQGELETIFSS